MRLSKLLGKARKTPSDRSSAASLTSSPPAGSAPPDSMLPGLDSTDDGKDARTPAPISRGSVQGERRTSIDLELRRESQALSGVASPGSPSSGNPATPGDSRHPYQADPDEGSFSKHRARSRRHSHNRKKQRNYSHAYNIGSANASPVIGSASKVFNESNVLAASPLPASTPDVAPVDAGEFRENNMETTHTSPGVKKKKTRTFSLRPKGHSHRHHHRQEPRSSIYFPGQNEKADAHEEPQATSYGSEADESSRRAKHRAIPLAWRFRKKAPSSTETPPIVTPRRGLRGADGGEDTSQNTLPSTPPSVQSPASTAAQRGAQSVARPSLSPPPGRTSTPSWSSLLAREASGGTVPMMSSFLSHLRGASMDSPGPEQSATEGFEHTTTAPEIEWACNEPESEVRSPANPAAVQASNAEEGGKNVCFQGERDDTDLPRVPEVPLTAGRFKIRTSKLPRFANLKDRRDGRPYNTSLLAFTAIASAMILAAVLTLAAALRNSTRHWKTTLTDPAEELQKMCKGGSETAQVGCLKAVQELSQAMDWSADPCSKLDQFTCGKWRRWNPNRHTHRQENVDNMSARIHELFLHLLNNLHLYGHEEGSMAVFYNSCRSYMASSKGRSTPVADVMSSLGLRSRMQAINVSTGMQGLTDFVVETSLWTGLPSVISVSSRAGFIYVDIGRTLTSSLGHAHVAPFLALALREMHIHNRSLNRIRDIENAVHRDAQPGDTNEPFVNTFVRVLEKQVDFAGSFVHALNRALPEGVPVHTVNSMVALRCLFEIRVALATLAADNLRMAYIYASAVLLAQVMRYAYMVHQGAALHGYDVTRTCVKITGEHFKALFPQWVTKKFVAQPLLAAFHAMTKALRQAFAHSDTATELGLGDSDLAGLKIVVVGERSVTAWRTGALAVVTPTHYDSDFLLNIVRASRDGVNIDYEEHAVELHMGGEIVIGEVDRQPAVFVPADFFLADMFYASAGPEVNFSTFGVWLLIQWIKAAILSKQNRGAATPTTNVPEGRLALDRKIRKARDRSKERTVIPGRARDSIHEAIETGKRHLEDAVGAKTECIAHDVSIALGRNVSEQVGRLLFFVNWALDVAFLAVEETHPELASSWWKDDRYIWQLFLLRFCHSLCGDEAVLDACRYQPLRSRDLARAFRCREPPPAGC